MIEKLVYKCYENIINSMRKVQWLLNHVLFEIYVQI